jgi:hypothetical protein
VKGGMKMKMKIIGKLNIRFRARVRMNGTSANDTYQK